MLIGIDASRANRGRKGGVEWYAYHLIKELAKLDKENQYILYCDRPLRPGLLDLTFSAFGDTGKEELPAKKNLKQEIKSLHNNFRGKVLGWPFRFLWTQGRLSLEMFLRPPDILFVPAHALPFIHPRKSIVTIHDVGFAGEGHLYSKDLIVPQSTCFKCFFNFLIRFFSHGRYKGSGWDYLLWSTKHTLRRAKKIITVSEFSRQEILRYFKVKKENIFVVHNGYDENLFKPEKDERKIQEVLEKYGLTRPFLFSLGRLEKKKNTDKLVEAFSLIRQSRPDIKEKLCLAGMASFGYDEIKYQIKEFNLGQEIIMPGWVAEDDLPALFSSATAFVFPSNYEGFGIPLLQAMACACPIVASKTTAIPETAGDSALFFNPDDVNDMADKIISIIDNPQIAENLRKAGLERVKNFSWQKCAEQTLKIINSLGK